MLHLGLPVVENHELTYATLDSLAESTTLPTNVVVIDNGSERRYDGRSFRRYRDSAIRVSLIRNEENIGFYLPILQLRDHVQPTSADLIGLMHNDLLVYEQGWDKRVVEEFVKDGDLALIGFCGSFEADDRGGRGGGTMCNFRGERGATVEDTGMRILDLRPALILDSLAMIMRVPHVNHLGVDHSIALNHFSDRVWPLRLIEQEWRVGVLGIECDHLSGQTAIALSRIEEDSRKWCEKHGVVLDEGITEYRTQVYLESERRYLSEYRDSKHFIPAKIEENWVILRPERARS